MPPVILGGLTAALLLASAAPAVAAAPVKPLSPAQLRAALITPEDLGSGFTLNPKRFRGTLGSEEAHTKKCVKALAALRPILRSKAASFIDKKGKPAGVRQFVISGTPARMASWRKAGQVMVRDCVRNRTGRDVRETITKLSVGGAGDWTYGIRYSKKVPEAALSPVHASDVVLVKVKNTVTLLVSDGYFSTFDSGLSRRAARVAVAKLRDAQ
ncbi:hypothetical protein ACSDR0_13595 [Streptosporangium sp. G11]|uniref:hypothetical protein n=1 Tax=Streptosporangium sp. G11 TaxID=3436926 RepID=UPI003EBEC9B1